MKKTDLISRRQFLGAATVAAGGLFLPIQEIPGSGRKSMPAGISSTDHFWYYKPPDSPYIDTQRGKKAFGFSDD
jgi:hypothetical protein